MNRYDIKPEGLGEINIDLSEDGEWVRFDDIENLLQATQKTAHNSDYAKCPHFGTISMLNEDTGEEEPLHVCTSGGHFA